MLILMDQIGHFPIIIGHVYLILTGFGWISRKLNSFLIRDWVGF